MAVESRFVVIRQGVEVETFMDKKSADEYDKMLDIADNLTEMLEQSPLSLDEKLTEDLSIFLAKNKEDLLVALQVKKAKPVAKAKKVSAEAASSSEAKSESKAEEQAQTSEQLEEAAPVADVKASKATPAKTARKKAEKAE